MSIRIPTASVAPKARALEATTTSAAARTESSYVSRALRGMVAGFAIAVAACSGGKGVCLDPNIEECGKDSTAAAAGPTMSSGTLSSGTDSSTSTSSTAPSGAGGNGGESNGAGGNGGESNGAGGNGGESNGAGGNGGESNGAGGNGGESNGAGGNGGESNGAGGNGGEGGEQPECVGDEVFCPDLGECYDTYSDPEEKNLCGDDCLECPGETKCHGGLCGADCDYEEGEIPCGIPGNPFHPEDPLCLNKDDYPPNDTCYAAAYTPQPFEGGADYCTDVTASDPSNCGGCGNVCTANEECVVDKCAPK